MGTNEKLLAQIRRNRDFDDHVITRERYGLWYCGERGTGNMSFRVVSAPGMLMLYGDIGEIIFLPHNKNALRWAGGDTFRPDWPYYPMTKLSPQMREKEFRPELVEDYLKDRIKDRRKDRPSTTLKEQHRYTREAISLLRAWRDDHGETLHDWYEFCQEHDIDDPPDCQDYPVRTYWCFQAMCWFMTHVTSEDPRFAEELKP